MDQYIGYSAKEFLVDDHFLRWMEGADPAVNQQWEAWLLLHPERMDEIAQARLILISIQFNEQKFSAADIQLEWARFQSGIEELPSVPVERQATQRIGRWWWKVAAIVGLVGLAIAGHKLYEPIQEIAFEDIQQTVALPGKRVMVVLPDGSKVNLNSGSRLTYSKSFLEKGRSVSLEGEAFFEVKRDTLRPFVIHTGKLSTEVLGTSFAIRAYKGQSDIEVAVVEGKVRVNSTKKSAKQEGAVLVKDEMATFDLDSEKINIGAFDPSEQIFWKDGIIHFKKADFPAIIQKLERCYGVKFQVSKNVQIDKQWRYTGRFANKSLEYILEVISYPNRFQYHVKDESVKITK